MWDGDRQGREGAGQREPGKDSRVQSELLCYHNPKLGEEEGARGGVEIAQQG